MKKYLIKTILFLVPIGALIGFEMMNYTHDQGDLARMSYLNINYNYDKAFGEENNNRHIVIENDSSITTKKKWTYFTIGDSFFQQYPFGIVNHLSMQYPNNVVNFRRQYLKGDNPIQTLQGLINSDYFDSVQVEYVVLESVERLVTVRNIHDDSTRIYSFEDIQKNIAKEKAENIKDQENTKKPPYPTDRFVKFYLNNIFYQFTPIGLNGSVYKESLDGNYFTTKSKDLLFYWRDVDYLQYNNDVEEVEKLNRIINRMSNQLKEKGIKLIFLVCPDKYNIYYSHLVNKENYTRPQFFDYLNALDKQYIYVEVDETLRKMVDDGQKDIYLFDDTHSSPWASKAIVPLIINASQ